MNSMVLMWWAVVALGGLSAVAAGDKSGTNLVFIMTDDQGAWSLGCYGNAEARTPGLDRLATEGIRFRRAFATTPVSARGAASNRIPWQRPRPRRRAAGTRDTLGSGLRVLYN